MFADCGDIIKAASILMSALQELPSTPVSPDLLLVSLHDWSYFISFKSDSDVPILTFKILNHMNVWLTKINN